MKKISPFFKYEQYLQGDKKVPTKLAPTDKTYWSG